MKRSLTLALLLTLFALVAGTSSIEALPPKCSQPNCDTLHYTTCSTPGSTTLCADWSSSACTTYTCRCSTGLRWFCP